MRAVKTGDVFLLDLSMVTFLFCRQLPKVADLHTLLMQKFKQALNAKSFLTTPMKMYNGKTVNPQKGVQNLIMHLKERRGDIAFYHGWLSTLHCRGFKSDIFEKTYKPGKMNRQKVE